MASHNDLGKEGEARAVAYLESKGYEIWERNWRYLKAEIDIIAFKAGILVIVEVKTRSSLEFGLPQEFITHKKIQLLVLAAHQYVQYRNLDCEVRFDIVAVYKEQSSFSVQHLQDAFYYF